MANVATATCSTNAHGTNRKEGYWNSTSTANTRRQFPEQKVERNSKTRESSSKGFHPPRPNQGQHPSHNGSNYASGRQNRPAYLRLDSTGENSCSGSSEGSTSSGGCSPQPQAQFEPSISGAPKFPQHRPQGQGKHPGQHSNPGPRTYGQRQQQHNGDQGFGIFDRVSSAFAIPHIPGRYHQNFMSQITGPSSDSTLANLDLVAEKFTNMSCNMMRRTPDSSPPGGQRSQDYSGHFHGLPQSDINLTQRNATFAQSAQRYQPESFHPYCGSYQSSFTFGYRRTFNYQPWQQQMDPNRPPFCNFRREFPNSSPRHGQQNQYGQFHWQPHWNPCMTPLMQEWGNQGNNFQHQRKQPPGKNFKQRTNYHHGNRKRTCNKSHSSNPKGQSSESVDKTKTESCATSACSEELMSLPESCQNNPEVHQDILAKTSTTESHPENVDVHAIRQDILAKTYVTENHPENVDVSAIETPITDVVNDAANEQCEASEVSQQTSVEEQPTEICKLDVGAPEPQTEDSLICPEIQRHSSIDLILSAYETKSVAMVTDKLLSTDSDFSDADVDSMEDGEHSDLWESFTSTDDPYNPLCGWRCNSRDSAQPPASSSANQSKAYIRDSHMDSGTDEGDDWSEADDTEESEADDEDEIEEDEVDCGIARPPSLELSDSIQQLTNRQGNLSSTPKGRSDGSSASHHPSVAFILGSTSSSSSEDDDDDDDDWDTVEDSSMQLHDPLWESFNKVKDPYSPLNAWKCHSSNLSSPESSYTNLEKLAPSNSPPKSTPNSGKITLECLSKSLPAKNHSSGRFSSNASFSDSETFAILSVRVYASSRDEADGGGGSSNARSNPRLKRVVSASCLRKVHLKPEIKATKKVRFSPSSSFIVLLEKESRSRDDLCASAGTDWQACARDRMRFRTRIDQAALVLDPILQAGHRESVYQARLNSDGSR